LANEKDLLRNPPKEHELSNGENSLKEGRDSPGPAVVDVLRAECQPTANERTKIPQAIVDGGDLSTMLRMRNFGDKHGAGELGQGVAETHEESGALVLWAAHRGGLDGGCDDHDDATNSDGSFTAKLVAEERNNGERNNGTDGVHGGETAQSVLGWVVHCQLPGVEDLRSVHERSSHSQSLDRVCLQDQKLTHRNQWWPSRRKESCSKSRACACWATCSMTPPEAQAQLPVPRPQRPGWDV
jgi:hypothetical protein